MRNYLISSLFVAFLFLLPDLSYSGMKNGELSGYCDDMATPAYQSYCNGYIQSNIDLHNILFVGDIITTNFCFENGMTIGQLRKMYMKYLNNQPEILKYEASSTLYSLFVTSFPCK